MKRKGEQNILALMAFKLRSKDRLCQGKSMSDVQVTIGVRVRERYEERLFVRVRIGLECSFFFPHGLHSNFVLTQRVAFKGSFRPRRSAFVFRCHDAYFRFYTYLRYTRKKNVSIRIHCTLFQRGVNSCRLVMQNRQDPVGCKFGSLSTDDDDEDEDGLLGLFRFFG